jgi:enoyl-CoA hydratase/carnithine racemase
VVRIISSEEDDRGTVHREDHAGVSTLTLERGRHNALTGAFADQLVAALSECDADPAVRVIVLTGAGPSFSVGADLTAGPASIRALLAADGGGTPNYREPAGRATVRMAALGKPVIAAVNGDAVGGGATVTLAADLRLAADTARFSFPFTRLGLCPEGASTYFLPRLVGPSRAADWLLSGRLIGAAEAERTGLANRVLPAGELLGAAQEYARELAASTSPAAVAVTRALLAAGPGTVVEASDAESRAIVALAAGADCAEGVAAFLQRRPPRFTRADPAEPPASPR